MSLLRRGLVEVVLIGVLPMTVVRMLSILNILLQFTVASHKTFVRIVHKNGLCL